MEGLTMSFLVDGELRSWQESAATAFSLPREVGLDMRRRLPGLSVGLAASFAVDADRSYQGS
jgi:hypothetical protein